MKLNLAITSVGGALIYDLLEPVIRGLPDHVKILGIDQNRNASGRFLCDLFSSITAVPGTHTWLESVMATLESCEIGVFIPLSEKEVSATSLYKAEFERAGVSVSVPDLRYSAIVNNKLSLYDFLAKIGVNDFAYGPFIKSKTSRDWSNLFGDKFVIKSQQGSGSRGVYVVDERCERFESLLDDRSCGIGPISHIKPMVEHSDGSFLVMEYLQGEFYDVDVVYNPHWDSPFVACRRRQLRNPFSPVSTGHLIERNTTVENIVIKAWESLGKPVLCDFDVVVNEDRASIIDGSFRCSGSSGALRHLKISIILEAYYATLGVDRGMPVIPDKAMAVRPFTSLIPIVPHRVDEIL